MKGFTGGGIMKGYTIDLFDSLKTDPLFENFERILNHEVDYKDFKKVRTQYDEISDLVDKDKRLLKKRAALWVHLYLDTMEKDYEYTFIDRDRATTQIIHFLQEHLRFHNL